MELEVRFEPSGRSARVERGTTLLEAARCAGLPVASSCGAEGICGRCGMEILTGDEALDPASPVETEIKRMNRIDPALRLSCRLELSTNLVVTAPYW